MLRIFIHVLFLIFLFQHVSAQENATKSNKGSRGQGQSTETADTTEKRAFKRLDIFPAISYSPETSLTLGGIGIKYFDLAQGDMSVPISNLEFVAVYTLNSQIIIETRWELFTKKNLWRIRGEAFFNRFPDRNYGMGNRAAAIVVEVDGAGVPDTLNYLNFDSDRIKFSPVILRKIRPNLYFGLQYDMEYLYRIKVTSDEHYFINEDALVIKNMAVEGVRSGIGFQLLFDTRDKPLNPIKGSLIALNNINYVSFLGSDYRFTTFILDARHYINTYKNQTLAVRAYGSANLTNDEIPMRALSRVGGDKFIRGYFKGTYQDHHMTAFELEYRLPFWEEGTEAKLSQFWKRLGLVGFIGGAQVFNNVSDFQMNNFNLGVGAGLRILFNPQSRVNIRIDYAIGLSKGSDGFNKRQNGLYFNFSEAF
jgi:outer membrane protein assembly factor BamA